MYLAQPLRLQLNTCAAPGIYLRWLDNLGCWPGWLFSGDQDSKTDLTESSSLLTADARTQVAVRRAGRATLVVRAGDLSDAQHQALSTILDSPQVYVQAVGGGLMPVLVSASTTATRTSADGRHELEIELTLPARNALTH